MDGPYADRPAFDFIAQAMSGLMSVNGKKDKPLRVSIPISDLVAGLYAAYGIVCALFHRSQTGQGQEVQTCLVDGLISFLSYMAANFLSSGQLPARTGNDHPIVAPYGLFKASDDYLAIAPSNDQIYERLLNALDLNHIKDIPELATNDQRMANRDKINGIIQDKIAHYPRAYWIEHLNREGIPCGPIHDLKDVFQDQQVHNQGMLLDVEQPGYGVIKMTGFPVKLGATPNLLRLPAPKLGEHTEDVLCGLGLSDEEIGALRNKKVI